MQGTKEQSPGDQERELQPCEAMQATEAAGRRWGFSPGGALMGPASEVPAVRCKGSGAEGTTSRLSQPGVMASWLWVSGPVLVPHPQQLLPTPKPSSKSHRLLPAPIELPPAISSAQNALPRAFIPQHTPSRLGKNPGRALRRWQQPLPVACEGLGLGGGGWTCGGGRDR